MKKYLLFPIFFLYVIFQVQAQSTFTIQQLSLISGRWEPGDNNRIIFYSHKYHKVNFYFKKELNKKEIESEIQLQIIPFTSNTNDKPENASFQTKLSTDKKTLTIILPEDGLNKAHMKALAREYRLIFNKSLFSNEQTNALNTILYNCKDNSQTTEQIILRPDKISKNIVDELKKNNTNNKYFSPGFIAPICAGAPMPIIQIVFSEPVFSKTNLKNIFLKNKFDNYIIIRDIQTEKRIDEVGIVPEDAQRINICLPLTSLGTGYNLYIGEFESLSGKIFPSFEHNFYCPSSKEYKALRNSIFQTATMTASSTLSDSSGTNYSADNLLKQNSNSWAEGEKGNGIGTELTLTLKKPIYIRYLYIINGYGDLKNFYKNNRVKSMTVSDEHGRSGTITLKDTYTFQQLLMAPELYGKKFTFRITEVYKGTEYNDTCLTVLKPGNLKSNNPETYCYPEYLKNNTPNCFKEAILTDSLKQNKTANVKYDNFSFLIDPSKDKDRPAKNALGVYLMKNGNILIADCYSDSENPYNNSFKCFKQGKEVNTSQFITIPEYRSCYSIVCTPGKKEDHDLLQIDVTTNGTLSGSIRTYIYKWNGIRFTDQSVPYYN